MRAWLQRRGHAQAMAAVAALAPARCGRRPPRPGAGHAGPRRARSASHPGRRRPAPPANGEGLAADAEALDAAVAAAMVPGSFGNPPNDPVTRSVVIIHRGQLLAAVFPALGIDAPTANRE